MTLHLELMQHKKALAHDLARLNAMQSSIKRVVAEAKKAERYREAAEQWRKGCSCAGVAKPFECVTCTEAYFNAIAKIEGDQP